MIEMIVVEPSTWQSTSWFFELSSTPFSATVIGRAAFLTSKGTNSRSGVAKKPRTGLLSPGTLTTATPPRAASAARPSDQPLTDWRPAVAGPGERGQLL